MTMAYLGWRDHVPDTAPPISPEVHISYGQSWRGNAFADLAAFNLNPQHETLLTPLVSSIGQPTFMPGPLPASAGISMPGNVIGITGYTSSEWFTIGRCAVLSQQLYRLRQNMLPLHPILEFCAAFPGSTWQTGGGGGLSPGAAFTASITNNIMTVTAVASRELALYQVLQGPGVPVNMVITGGPNPGTVGTYNVGISTLILTTQLFTANADFIGEIRTDILTVSTINSGTIIVGDVITNIVPANSYIMSQLTGTPGGLGTYRMLLGGVLLSLPSGDFTAYGVSWHNQATIITQLLGILPSALNEDELALGQAHLAALIASGELIAPVAAVPSEPSLHATYIDPVFRSVGYTQGGAADGTIPGKESDLTDMLQLYDAMNLPGTDVRPLNYYIGVAADISSRTAYNETNWGSASFCRTNAPGRGGPFSGRVFGTTTWYQWLFRGDSIHTDAYGTMREGEIEGYVKHLVEDVGILWTPLWRSLTLPIRITGQTIAIPFDRPAGPDFAGEVLEWQSDPDDGIQVWPNYGFNARRSNAFLTISLPVIVGMEVRFDVQQPLAAGDVLEVSVAWYGPGGPATQSGIGANLVMNGPASELAPGKRIGSWVWPHRETVTV
jgi:hypothetical protein